MAIGLIPGQKIVKIGNDQKSAMVIEIQQYVVEQVARIYNIPPVLLNDLSKGTFANTEQSGHHLAKYTVNPLCTQIEQELTYKLFGNSGGRYHVQHDLTDLLKGDSEAFTNSMSTAITSGQITLNEARAAANRDPVEGGDELFLNGGSMPLSVLLKGWQDLGEPAPENDIMQQPVAEENDDTTEDPTEDQA